MAADKSETRHLRWDCTACLPGEGCNATASPSPFVVVVVTGPQTGAEVTSGGVPWRGSLADARALRDRMTEQARGFGRTDASYMVEALGAIEPCDCGHLWSAHDAGGCHHEDGCLSDGAT